MRIFKRSLALVLTVIMVVTALPLSVFAADSNASATAATDDTSSEQYFYKFTFDDLSAATKKEVGFASWGNTSFASNPMNLVQDGWGTSDVIADEKNPDNKYIHLDYSRLPANGGSSGGWRGFRFSLYEPSTGIDHLTANGVSVKFKFRWLGTDDACDAKEIDFFKLRRKNAYGNGEIYLIKAATNDAGDLVLKALIPASGGTNVTRKNVYCFKKNSTEFSNIEIKYHDVTATYSLIIDGKPIVESVYVGDAIVGKDSEDNYIYDDVRSDYFVKKTYDNDFMTTSRQPLAVATADEPTNTATARRSAFEIMRLTNSSIKGAFVCDIDDFIIQEDQVAEDRVYYYKNTFDAYYDSESEDTYKPYNGLTGNYMNNMFTIQGTASDLVLNYDKNTDNGYLTFNSNPRLDLLDVYQVIQDGNWTVSFDIQATNTSTSLQTIIGLYDFINSPRILQLDNEGYLYVGIDKYKLTGAKIPAFGSDDWVNVKLSVFYTNENEGSFYDFISDTNTNLTMKRCYAVYVDDKLIGVHTGDPRNEANTSTLINNVKYTETALSAEPTEAELEGYTLAEDKTTLKTWRNASGDLYQVKYTKNTDGTYSFAAGVKIKMGSAGTGDTLSFFRKGEKINANIDNLEVYSGIGNPNLAGGKSDTAGVINEVAFADINTTGKPTAVGNYTPANGGEHGIVGASNFTSDRVAAKSETDADGKTVNYVTLTSGATDVYFGLNADYSGGKVFSAEMTLRKLSGMTKDFYLLRLRRQTETATASVPNDLLNYSYSDKKVVFTYGGEKAFLCDAGGKPVTLTGNKWTTLKAVVDETSGNPLVTFYVNGRVACYTTANNLVPFKAVNLDGVIADSFSSLKDAIDQGVRFFQTDSSSVVMDLLDAKIEYAEAYKRDSWSDSASIDFSKINDISELDDQFLVSDGCYIENGALVVPKGEVFGWIDYNGTFANFQKTNAVDPLCQYRVNCGYNIEAKIKTAPSTSQKGMMKVTSVGTANQTIVFMQNGKLYMSGGTSGYVINDLESNKFSEISATYVLSDGNKTVFADGKMVGIVGWSGTAPSFSTGKEIIAFTFADESIISEAYIHADQARTLALNEGNIFEIDPNAFLPTSTSKYPGMGVWDARTYTSHGTRVTNDGDFNYYSFNFVASEDEVTSDNYGKVLTAQTYSDVYVTDYLEDKTTVFEYDLRFTRHSSATGKPLTLARIRRTEHGSTGSTNVSENLIVLYDNGRIQIHSGYYLCHDDGSYLVIPDGEWINVATIYDADSGKISYVVDGKIYNYRKTDGTMLGLAKDIQLPNSRLYRMDAADTKIRIIDVTTGFVGKLDIAKLKIYNIDGTANAGYVGAQKDTANNNIRLVAGTDMLYYGSVGFEVEAFDANGKSLADVTKSYSNNIVYSSIKADGITEYPETYGYRYFFTANIVGIPQDKAVKLNVTPFTEVNGVRYKASTVTLDINFIGSRDNWILDTDSIEVKPVGTNTSNDANFSATDIVKYTNDGALELNGLGAKFAFAADLKGGVVSVNLTNAKGEVATNSVFDIYVDGTLKETKTLEFGHHTLVLAENLTGEHEFMIVKRSGGDFVCINNMSVTGTLITPPSLAEKDAVIVMTYDPEDENKNYGNVHVYVKTSDPSGKYYIRYHFDYFKNATNDYTYLNGKANTGNNRDMYRINEAHLVKMNEDGSFTTQYKVLQSGEVSLAIKEKHLFTLAELTAAGAVDSKGNAYTKDTAISAPDFVGGFHGDENMIDVGFYIDGVEIDPTKEATYTNVTHFEFVQDSIVNRCDEEDEDVMLHGQHILLDTNGLRLNQRVEFLCNDFYPSAESTYLQMCTLYRVNTSLSTTEEKANPANYVCADAALLDANGNVLLTEDLRNDKYSYDPSLGTKNVWVGESEKLNSRYIEYYGNNNGLYGKAGFVISDASVKSDSAKLAVRRGQGDNKWYASFDTLNKTGIPYLGEVWNVSNYYFVDFNTANIK